MAIVSVTLLSAVGTALLCFAVSVQAQCSSFGLNIASGGTYYFNPLSTAPFSFEGGFDGCIPDTVTTSLQLPDGTTLSCTPVNTDNTGSNPYESVCPIDHADMAGGAYTIFLLAPNNGVEFGRSFTVVTTQATLFTTITPTVTVSSTPVTVASALSTTSVTDTSTASPLTVTSPAATSGTLTLKPIVHTTSTKVNIVTKITHTDVTSTRTITTSGRCRTSFTAATSPKAKDAQVVLATKPSSSSKPVFHAKVTGRSAPADSAQKQARRALIKRDGPDGPLTVTSTNTAPTSSTTVILPTSTLTETNTIELISEVTVTPTPATVFSGTVQSTETLPTMTITSTAHSSSTTTSTVTRTQTAVVFMPKPC